MPFLKILKRYAFIFFFVISFCLIFGTDLTYSVEKDNSSKKPLAIKPFSLPTVRANPGQEFLIEIKKGLFTEKVLINEQLEIFNVTFEYDVDGQGDTEPFTEEIPREDFFFKPMGNKEYLVVVMPSWHAINDIRTQRWWRGIFLPYKATLKVVYQATGQKVDDAELFIEIPDRRWATIWGLLVVIGSFFLVWVLVALSKARGRTEEKDGIAKRFFLFPLRFAISPLGRYSISLTQILLWTSITIFGIVYVYWLTGGCLEITSQLLMLLGIGGGTAVGAKINAISRSGAIPSKYLNLVRRNPELSDLICIGDEINIFKFQILVFSLLIAYIVLMEIFLTHTVPHMPENLTTLMGMSGGVYLGNEVVLGQGEKKEKSKLIVKVKDLIDDIEEHALKKNKPIKNAQQIEELKYHKVDELTKLLNIVFS
jgi:hypothetical protein